MFASASLSIGGVSDEWKEDNDGWCYTATIIGQVGGVAAMGWNFAIIIDLVVIAFYPTYYCKNEKRNFRKTHLIIWSVAICSGIPAIATGSVGISPDKTCWMLGSYIWAFWGFWCVFVVSAVTAILASVWKLCKDGCDSQARPLVKVACSADSSI